MKHKRVIFISSRDRAEYPGGDNFDFYIDLENTLTQMGPEFAGTDRRDVNISMSVSQLFVPFNKESLGFIDRVKPYYKGTHKNGSRHIPQVQMLRLHTDIIHDNMTPRGHSSVVLNVPFMEHYKEADLTRDYTFSHLSYNEENDQHTGRFHLIHGLQSLHTVRFWLTDEGNRLIRPKHDFDVYITLTVYAESAIHEKRHQNELISTLKELTHLNRLLLIQGESQQAAREHVEQEQHKRRHKRRHGLL